MDKLKISQNFILKKEERYEKSETTF